MTSLPLPARHRAAPAAAWLRHLAAVVTGITVLGATGWVAPALGAALLVAAGPWLFGGGRAARDRMARLDAFAGWTEAVRDRVWAGAGLPDALTGSLSRTPDALRPELAAFAGRITVREPLDVALAALADDLADPAADTVIASLILNARTSGTRLVAVLSSLAASLRAQLADQRETHARQAESRAAVRFAVAITVGMLTGLAALNPAYMAPYRDPHGQLVLAAVTAVYAAAFVQLRRLADYPAPPRLLAAPPPAGPPLTSRIAATTSHVLPATTALAGTAHRVLAQRGWPGPRLRADLTLLGAEPAQVLAEQVACTLAGLLTLPVLAAARPGTSILLPAWLALLAAATGALTPYHQVRRAAQARRGEFAATTATYADLIAMRLASGAGLAEAVRDAANVGRSPAFTQIRAIIVDARTAGLSYPDALDQLATTADLPDLQDLAATLAHVEIAGAHAETTLRDKAASLRARQRAAAYADAARRTHALSAAQALLGLGFLILIGYPALTAVTAVTP